MKSKLVWLIVLLVCGGVGYKFYSDKHVSSRESNQVTLMSPQFGDIIVEIISAGLVQPQNRLEIMPPISGRIETLFVEEGQNVQKGDILGVMSSSERAALIDAARSQGKDVQAYWEATYKMIPLISPITGTVIVKAVEPGQTVGSTTPVLVLSDRLIVKAQVDETDISTIKKGQKTVVALDAYPDIQVDSKVDHIAYESTLVNNVTTYEVDVVPSRVPDVFRSGMSAEVRFFADSKSHVLTLPVSAVVYDKNEPVVYVYQGHGVPSKKVFVELGLSDGKRVEIKKGLSEDDQVVLQQSFVMGDKKETKTNPFSSSRSRKK